MADNFTFNSTEDEDYIEFMNYFETHSQRHFVPIVMAICFIVGVLVNGALVFVFLLDNKYLRVTPNNYIFSLAVSDLLVVLFSAPLKAIELYYQTNPFSEAVCKITDSLAVLSFSVTALTLMALTVWYYLDVRKSTSSLQDVRTPLQARRITVFAIAFIWIVSFVLATPTMVHVFLENLEFHSGETQLFVCTNYSHNEMELLRLQFHYAIPLVVVGCLYIKIRRIQNRTDTTQNQTRVQIEFSRFIFTLVILHAIFSLPSYIFYMWYAFNEHHSEEWYIFSIWAYCLSFAFHCISPIVLYCICGEFRNLISKHLPCWCFGRDQATVVENELVSLQNVENKLN